ncbi:glycosyltransferase [Halobacillus sp. SY10]|uniref:glycosyltransferase n=1 Tax=Halobacillus sp. SY10 TaxID=3381356 RepID=UPI00387A579F
MVPKVSIIVPIYNMEKYIHRCLDSILVQSLKEIELILVNDGSTDTSKFILNEYEERDGRVKVLHKKNGGVSSARNAGIEIATGEFVGFVDPDDWIESTMYKDMYEAAMQERADVVMCSYVREFGTHSKIKDYYLPRKVSYEKEEVYKHIQRKLIGPLEKELARPELLDAWGTVWSKLYKNEIIQKYALRFQDLEKIGTNEDSLFNIQFLKYTSKFIFLNQPFYHYWRENENSITSTYKPDLLEKWFYLYQLMAEGTNDDPEYQTALKNRICLNTLGLGLNVIGKDNPQSMMKKILIIKDSLEDYRVRNAFKQFELTHFPIVWKLFYFLAKKRHAAGVYSLLIAINFLRKVR